MRSRATSTARSPSGGAALELRPDLADARDNIARAEQLKRQNIERGRSTEVEPPPVVQFV